jgi:hypothetical protein
MKKNILLLNIVILVTSCCVKNTENCHKIITVVNNTDKAIYVKGNYRYPNTDAYKNSQNPLNSGYSKVLAHESSQGHNKSETALPSFGDCYEAIYSSLIESDTMMVYIFDGPTLETKGYNYIKENELVLKRYDLTLKDLDSLNWTITYDGE